MQLLSTYVLVCVKRGVYALLQLSQSLFQCILQRIRKEQTIQANNLTVYNDD